MILQQISGAAPGLWTAPGAAPGAPGTYALIVGVSEYAGPQIPKLHTSAYTAARLFDWLCARERYAAAPLRWCRLLLAPTEAERAAVASEFGLAAGAYADADFATLDKAIRAWYAAMHAVPLSARESRSFFYFCGHGVEFATGRQILLPSDYLEDGLTGQNNAASSWNLMDGLGDLNVDTQLFFFDACRNDGPLRDIVPPTGAEILGVPLHTAARRRIALSATLSGGTTAQFDDIANGGSFFGLAMHEALTGTPVPPSFPDLPDVSAQPNVVRLAPLMAYINARMDSLYGKKLEPVEFLGPFAALTMVAGELPPPPPPPAPRPVRSGGGTLAVRGTESLGESVSDLVPRALQHDKRPAGLPSPAWPVMSALRAPLTSDAFKAMHDIVGHEYITDLVLGARTWTSANGRDWESAGPLGGLEAAADDLTALLTFEAPVQAENRFAWITWGGVLSFLLPPAPAGARYTLQAIWDQPGDALPGTASLSPAEDNVPALQGVSELWRNYTALVGFDDARAADVMTRALATKAPADVLAAEIVQLSLIRSGESPRAPAGDMALAELAADADAAVFALCARVDADTVAWTEIESLLSTIVHRGAPALRPSYGHVLNALDRLDSVVPRLLAELAAGADAPALNAVLVRASDVRRALAPATAAFRATRGLFARFALPSPF